MAKKCIPGVICVENMTLFILLLLAIVVLYLWMQVSHLGKQSDPSYNLSSMPPSASVIVTPTYASQEISSQDIRGDVGRCGTDGKTIGDPLTNPYVPPIRCNGGIAPISIPMIPGKVPINIPTQRYNTSYSQMGILTKQNSSGNGSDILPLMGRQLITSRSKWQYYTVSGGGPGGNLQTKLPVKAKVHNFKCISYPSYERLRISGKKKVNEFKDGFLILISIIKLFIKKI